jgi:sugar lactone lactonase YvrE
VVDLQRIGNSSDILGESPIWCPREQALYWVDVRRPSVQRYDTATGATRRWPMPEMVGSLALCESGGLLVALRSSIARFDLKTERFAAVAGFAGDPNMRLNDGKCDRRGRFWVGSMNDVSCGPEGFLYRLDKNGDCAVMADGIRVPNSLSWSLDDRTMYFTGPDLRTIFAYEFDLATGGLGERRVFADIAAPGLPDGATVDAEGFIWCAAYDGWRLIRYAPDGSIERTIDLPVQNPTSCAFGGPDLGILYVTTASQRLSVEQLAGQPLAGALLALDVGIKGLPEPRFAG